MSLGIGIGLPFGGAAASGGPVPIDAPFASVNGTGAYDSWSAEYAATPSVPSPVAFTASRQGYDASGNTTTYLDTLYVTTRVRKPYPDQADPSALTVALSDYIYSTDTPSGSVTNNATLTSPVPVCAWVTPHRSVVGSTIGGTVVPVEIVAFHRNARSGRQVASVVFSITDGTNPAVTCTPVSTTVVSNRTGDRAAVLVYRMPETDISSLNNNAVLTIRCQVYPWIGDSASVADSNNGTAVSGRDFGPRYFYKSTGLNTSPYYAYITTGGSAGGVFSTTPATAEATPFDTVANMFTALNSGAAGKADGVIVYIGDDGGTPFVLAGSGASRNQDCAAIIFTRDPNVARANARVSFGTSAFRPRLLTGLDTPLTTGCIRFTDIAIVRTGTSTFTGEAANQLEIQFDDVDFDNGSNSTTWLSNSHDYFYGVTFTNLTGVSALGPVTGEHRIMRGISVDPNFGTLDGWWTIGCALTRPGTLSRGTRTFNGSICAFNMIRNPTTSTVVGAGSDQDVTGFAVVQNVFEYISATAATSIRISPDSATGNNTHVIIHNNTFVGALDAGRANIFYDEGATARSSRLMSVRGNIHVQINTKGDVFQTDGTRLGNWAYLYGVGCQGEWSQFIDAGNGGLGTSFAQAYAGRGSDLGTTQLSSTANMANTDFTSFAATTVAAGPAYSAGAGGGTYTVSGSAPVEGIVETAVLSHDLAGTARPTTADTAGAYVAP
jgi:hypothetical protein